MAMHVRAVVVCLFVSVANMMAQGGEGKPLDLIKEGAKLIEKHAFQDAVNVLEGCLAEFPENYECRYLLGSAKFNLGQYREVAVVMEELLKSEDRRDLMFRMLGVCQDKMGDTAMAISTFKRGLVEFPSSAPLYSELGEMYVRASDHSTALSYFERGIEMGPAFPSNYYWATKHFCDTKDPIWGMLYGEIFLNLEPYSDRSTEIAALLFASYQKEIKFLEDEKVFVSFASTSPVDFEVLLQREKNSVNFTGLGYELPIVIGALREREINLASLSRIRERFILWYLNEKTYDVYPNILYYYQFNIIEGGFMEAYTHWILRGAQPQEYERWERTHKASLASFLKWRSEHPLTLTQDRKFYRRQYDEP